VFITTRGAPIIGRLSASAAASPANDRPKHYRCTSNHNCAQV